MKSISLKAVLCLFFTIGLIGWGNIGFAASVTTITPAAFVLPGLFETGSTSEAVLCITQENTASTADLQSRRSIHLYIRERRSDRCILLQRRLRCTHRT